jgi:glycosyltransferase involved in cell wall biosynthesis
MSVSVVLNTYNEENTLARCLDSVKWANEIIMVDMGSTDRTIGVAQQFGARVYPHPHLAFVEPARNFAIEKATGDWVLILDADEVIPQTLIPKLKELANLNEYDFVRIPRKNIIFGRWLKHSGWWPDLLIRYFKKGYVSWNEEIHSVPITRGIGLDLPAEEENAIIHYHYQTISQYLERLNRYTDQEANQLVGSGYKFSLKDLIIAPRDEFLRRFFAWEGYKDGTHGFVLSFLQAFSFFVTYLKVWEKEKWPQQTDVLGTVGGQIKGFGKNFNFWYWQKKAQKEHSFKKFLFKVAARLRL